MDTAEALKTLAALLGGGIPAPRDHAPEPPWSQEQGPNKAPEPSFMAPVQRKILMACPNYWDSPFRVGSHHLARGFADSGWRVAYISDPISPLHWLSRRTGALSERFDNYRVGRANRRARPVWAYVPGALLTR